MKRIVAGLCLLCCSIIAFSQQQSAGSLQFWKNIQQHCGKVYQGMITQGGREGDGFTGKPLLMQVISCEENTIRIPFYVGEDKSRTWVLTLQDSIITLKHDHRHEDGSEDKITQYGGTSPNTGHANMQIFPADQQTCSLLNYACTNIWWMTITDKVFSYNLQRTGSDRIFTVAFDLTKEVKTTFIPWGWKQ